MSYSSVEARPANRAVGNLILVVLALLLALLSTKIGSGGEPGQREAMASPVVEQSRQAAEPRGLFGSDARTLDSRRYHPAFETSNSAGALGLWILASLFGLLLGAAVAPRLLQRLKRHA